MIAIAVTQRVSLETRYAERRDALDQRFWPLLRACGLLPVPMPNDPQLAMVLFQASECRGLLLSGGNDLVSLGGDTPERDETERALLAHCRSRALPVLGICRGMQLIQESFGVPLGRVNGHVGGRHRIHLEGEVGPRGVNSFHGFGTTQSVPALEVIARSEDGVVKAIRHRCEPLMGIMWHPERDASRASQDVALIRSWLGAPAQAWHALGDQAHTRGIILAAGRGSRMGNATAARPKCLVELGGRALLDWQLAALRTGGVGEVAAVRGYRAADINRPGLRSFDNPRWAQTNMVQSLACADAWLQEEVCVVSYSDIVYDAGHVEALRRSQAPVAITYDLDWLKLWSRRFADPLEDAETFRVDAQGRLLEIGGRAESVDEIQGQYMGLLQIRPAGWAQMRRIIEALPAAEAATLQMTPLLQRLVQAGATVEAVPVRGGWCEVDSESDRRLYEEMLAAGELQLPAPLLPWAPIHGRQAQTSRQASPG